MDNLIIFGAKYLFVVVVLIYGLALWQASPKHRKQLLVGLVVAGIIAVILDKIGGKLFYDPRPFVTHHIKPLVAHSADNGFPSEHTILTFAIGSLIAAFRPKLGGLALVLALLVGISRVAAHIHSPIDIIGGAAIGLAAGAAGYYASQKFLLPKKN